ncbi:MAG: thermonuclease family protein [Ignavibacteria bacterium]|nr:thermonuclease family protein [Ignavibacteria bacterium]
MKRVIDGDTFELEDGRRVRLIGIDTPEKYNSEKLDRDAILSNKDKETIKKLGQLATNYVKSFVEGRKVYLEAEESGNDKDRYGRLLRYVYLEDGTLVNAKILKDGYAYVYEQYPFSKQEEFRQYYREARENNKGLWGNIENLEQF